MKKTLRDLFMDVRNLSETRRAEYIGISVSMCESMARVHVGLKIFIGATIKSITDRAVVITTADGETKTVFPRSGKLQTFVLRDLIVE